MLCESNAIRTRTLLWFEHGCSVSRMQFRTRTLVPLVWYGHGCSVIPMQLEHDDDDDDYYFFLYYNFFLYYLGMDAL